MILIYVAGPYRGSTREETELIISAAKHVGKLVARKGFMPVVPHTNTAGYEHLAPELTDEFWLDGTLEIMRRCDAVCMVAGFEFSSGSINEMKVATTLHMPIYRSAHHLPKAEDFMTRYGKNAKRV